MPSIAFIMGNVASAFSGSSNDDDGDNILGDMSYIASYVFLISSLLFIFSYMFFAFW